MNAPISLRQLKRPRTRKFRSIDERYQHYEILKSELTAAARTTREYDDAVREAARLAGV